MEFSVVMITATEFKVYEEDGLSWKHGGWKAYHFNLYSKDPNRVRTSLFSHKYIHPNARPYVTEEMLKDDDRRVYSQEYLNDAFRRAKEEGFLVSFNHPVWSLNHYPDYCDLEGVWGLEVVNYGGYVDGFEEHVGPLDDFLYQGKQVFPLATTDAHTDAHMFGGYVMVKAEKLEYQAVMNALERGDFYASTGPRFEELYLEDGVLKLRCSPVREILITSGRRFGRRFVAPDGQGLSHLEYDLNDRFEKDLEAMKVNGVRPYFRVTLRDFEGKNAYSRAFFTDERIEE